MDTRSRTLAIASVALITAGLAAYVYTSRIHADRVVAAAAARDANRALAGQAGSVAAPAPAPVALQRRTAAPDMFPLAMEDGLFPSKDQAQLEWLRRNGFPSEAAYRAAAEGAASPNDLDGSDGVSAYEILRAESLTHHDPAQRASALEFLEAAAAQGSIYALRALGNAYSIGRGRDNFQSEAYYRAAILRGDWESGFRVRNFPMTPEVDRFATVAAQNIVVALDAQRARAGLPPLPQDPKPGFEDALRVMNQHRAQAPAKE